MKPQGATRQLIGALIPLVGAVFALQRQDPGRKRPGGGGQEELPPALHTLRRVQLVIAVALAATRLVLVAYYYRKGELPGRK